MTIGGSWVSSSGEIAIGAAEMPLLGGLDKRNGNRNTKCTKSKLTIMDASGQWDTDTDIVVKLNSVRAC